MRPAVVSQSLKTSGSFPGAWSGSVTRHAEFRNFEAVWGDSSTRNGLQAKFDRFQVVSRLTNRAVEPVGFDEHYLSHSQRSFLPQFRVRIQSHTEAMVLGQK